MGDPLKILMTGLAKITALPGCSSFHIALYLSIVAEWEKQGFAEWIKTNRRQLMLKSTIKSNITYHRTLKGLIDKGVILYAPSYHPIEGSKIKIISSIEI